MRTFNRPDPWTLVGVGLIVLVIGAFLGNSLVALVGAILVIAAVFLR